ncbi:hypothetical protein FGLOB1_12070 [Fusarium globosum]|uniref:Uncharacterized protein n=1 Tax=Fusarium globosum TaxID=78864 RepID=A0A8H5XQU0_9HYPO|nr:hypothetical protein FGLOB1_12070 [Fusarium globosum]
MLPFKKASTSFFYPNPTETQSFPSNGIHLNTMPIVLGQWAGIYTYPNNDAHGGRRTDGESDFIIEDKEGNGALSGHGRDIIGDFHFRNLYFDGEKIKFTKQYAHHSWPYTGRIDHDTNIMHGSWGPDNQNAWGYFAFHLANKDNGDELIGTEQLDKFAGDWKGHYTRKIEGHADKRRDCNFKLHGETTDSADRLAISGKGEASTGEYRITGVVSPTDQIVFAKVLGNNTFLYRGVMEEGHMRGFWAGEGQRGTFEFSLD